MTSHSRSSTRRALLLATVTVGTLDGLDAIIFFGLRGVAPLRIFQSIASGLLGAESFKGGLATGALGVLLHFTVAFLIASTYFMISSRVPAIARAPFVSGPLFGVAAYLVMNQVVIPLSSARHGAQATVVVINGVLIHIFGVGLTTALFARSAFVNEEE